MTKSQKITVVGLCIAAVAVPVIVLRNLNRQEPYIAEVALSRGAAKYRLLKLTAGPLDYAWKDPSPQILRFLPAQLRAPYVGFMPIHLDGYTPYDRFPGVSYYFRPVDSKGRYSN